MPMDPGLIVQLVFWAALLGGLARGGAVGAWKGFNAGGATASLIIGVVFGMFSAFLRFVI